MVFVTLAKFYNFGVAPSKEKRILLSKELPQDRTSAEKVNTVKKRTGRVI